MVEAKENQLLETDTTALVASVAGGEIVTWSEDKKKEFVGTFKDRVHVARCILEKSALIIAENALRKKFIGQRHFDRLFRREAYCSYQFDLSRFTDMTESDRQEARRYGSRQFSKIGGREVADLFNIAGQRADDVLKSLPPLQKAVQIIDPETAKMLDRIDELKEKGEKLKEEAEEASEPIYMAEVDQKMTIGDFRKLVKEREKRRKELLQKLQDTGKEGSQLEAIVGKRLFKGLPGLAEAVVEVVEQHMDRSKALDAMSRRVEEQVKFGDSDAALELLRHFEKDEEEVSAKVKASFAEALEKLKISVKKGRVTAKALRGVAGAVP